MRRVNAPAPRVKTCARVAQAPLRLARPYSAAAKPEKPHVVTITSDKAWETHVVQGSGKQPVLVDFTASWCGARPNESWALSLTWRRAMQGPRPAP